MLRPRTPPALFTWSLMISRPSFTCVPCTTEPGGDCAMLMPILIGSAACAAIERPAAAAAASRQCRDRVFIGCSSVWTIGFGVAKLQHQYRRIFPEAGPVVMLGARAVASRELQLSLSGKLPGVPSCASYFSALS